MHTNTVYAYWMFEHLPNQVAYCKTPFIALPCLVYLIFNRTVAD